MVLRSPKFNGKRSSHYRLPLVVSAAKPSDDGRALIVHLFGASGKEQTVSLQWPGRHPAQLFLSNTSEAPLSKISDTIKVAGYELVTLRAEFK